MSLISPGPAAGVLRSVVCIPQRNLPRAGWPLVVFLHGRGESNADYKDPAAGAVVHGPLYRRHWFGWQPNFVVLCPQLPNGNVRWHQPAILQQLSAIINRVVNRYDVNPNRIAVAGFSIGGLGCYALARHRQNARGWRIRRILPVDASDANRAWRNPPAPETIDVSVWSHHRSVNKKAPLFMCYVVSNRRRDELRYRKRNHGAMGRECFQRPDIYTWLSRA